MFGFYYAAIGLVFGILCSVKAKEMRISNTEWFTIGFAFNIIAYLVLSIYAIRTNPAKEIDYPLNSPSSGVSY